jgi:opacity protein-like surface antigen
MSSASEQLATVAATAASAASAAADADAATEVATAEAVTAAAHAVEAAAGALVLDALTETTNTTTPDDDKWTTQQTLLETQAALILKLNADADDLRAQLASALMEIQSMQDHQALMALEPETVEVLTVPELTAPDQAIAEERLQADKTSRHQKVGFLL